MRTRYLRGGILTLEVVFSRLAEVVIIDCVWLQVVIIVVVEGKANVFLLELLFLLLLELLFFIHVFDFNEICVD